MKHLCRWKILMPFIFVITLANISSAQVMKKSKSPADNIYGLEKNAIEKSFGGDGKNIDRSDFSQNKKGGSKDNKKRKTREEVPSFDDLPVPSEANPMTLPPERSEGDKKIPKDQRQSF